MIDSSKTKTIHLGQYRLRFFYDKDAKCYEQYILQIKTGENEDLEFWETIPEYALSPLEKVLLDELVEEYLSSWDY